MLASKTDNAAGGPSSSIGHGAADSTSNFRDAAKDGFAPSGADARIREPANPVLSVLLALLFPALGVLVACIGFCDPDTCWHLALGKWMFTHHCLPYSDPFSSNVHDFVFVRSGLPLMQHEWLSDLLFYGTYNLGGARALLAATSLLSCWSLVILPWFLMRRNRVPNTVASALILLVCCASAFRLWVRPEAISFICMSALILVNDLCLQQAQSKRTVGLCMAATATLMLFWTNCHALFVAGVAYLCGFFVLSLLTRQHVQRSLGLLAAALLGTLFTPWGVALWQYIGRLLQSPISHANKENGPMQLTELANPVSWPLIGVIGFFLILQLSPLFRRRVEGGTSNVTRDFDWTSFLIGTAGAAVAVLFRRLTPLALLVVMAAVAMYYSRRSGAQEAAESAARCQPAFVAKAVGGMVASVIACICASYWLAAPEIPSPSHLFTPPYAAIEYLQQHRTSGRMLNDAKFGSMLTWRWKDPPDIFIDGRFDSFDRNLVYDYNDMRLCRGNWQALMSRYDIGWVFFPPKTPIVKALMETPGWTVTYSDASAVVLQR